MHTAKLSSKNQISIPKAITEMLNLKPKDYLMVVADLADECIHLKKIKEFDIAWHASMSSQMSEWMGDEDDDL